MRDLHINGCLPWKVVSNCRPSLTKPCISRKVWISFFPFCVKHEFSVHFSQWKPLTFILKSCHPICLLISKSESFPFKKNVFGSTFWFIWLESKGPLLPEYFVPHKIKDKLCVALFFCIQFLRNLCIKFLRLQPIVKFSNSIQILSQDCTSKNS